MLDNPISTAANVISLWQSNLVAVKLETFLNFRMGHEGAIALLTDADW
jgi:hypothetical protein